MVLVHEQGMETRSSDTVIRAEVSPVHPLIITVVNKGKYGKQTSEIRPAGSTINPKTGMATKFDMSAIADIILK